MEGTNNEYEAFQSFTRVGLDPEFIHLNDLRFKRIDLSEYSAIFLPGGFSAGDYIRAGVIFARRLADTSLQDLKRFQDEGKPIIGVCNGFQVLTETGMLPGWGDGISREIVLAPNDSSRYECRYTFITMEARNPLLSHGMSLKIPYLIPVAHAEGKIRIINPDKNLKKLEDNNQILFRYSTPEGSEGGYPWNPNGSISSIAAISNGDGNVIGLMPHPERLFYHYTNADRSRYGEVAVGQRFFTSIREYIVMKGF